MSAAPADDRNPERSGGLTAVDDQGVADGEGGTGDRQRPPALVVDHAGGGVVVILGDVSDRDGGALTCERQCGGTADPAGRAGRQRGLTREPSVSSAQEPPLLRTR